MVNHSVSNDAFPIKARNVHWTRITRPFNPKSFKFKANFSGRTELTLFPIVGQHRELSQIAVKEKADLIPCEKNSRRVKLHVGSLLLT